MSPLRSCVDRSWPCPRVSSPPQQLNPWSRLGICTCELWQVYHTMIRNFHAVFASSQAESYQQLLLDQVSAQCGGTLMGVRFVLRSCIFMCSLHVDTIFCCLNSSLKLIWNNSLKTKRFHPSFFFLLIVGDAPTWHKCVLVIIHPMLTLLGIYLGWQD